MAMSKLTTLKDQTHLKKLKKKKKKPDPGKNASNIYRFPK